MNLADNDQVSALATTIDDEDDELIEAVASGESPNGATGK